LTRHECVNVRFQISGQPLRWPFRIDGRVVEITPEPRITVDASDGVAAVLAAGGGIGMSATYIAAPYVRRGELVPILTRFAVQRSAITALWPESRRGSPNVKAFLAFLAEVFPSPPPWDEFLEAEATSPQRRA
jgi:DNA-binding transcriptional LysR family regulator